MMLEAGLRLAVAGLAGLAVGIEREWSGHATGPDARFAGVRTFLLLGLIGGLSGWTIDIGMPLVGAPLLVGAAALVVAAYVLAARRPGASDATTEVAGLAVLLLGAVAGLGHLALVSGVAAVMVLALREKAAIRRFIALIGEPELRAAFQFAVLALVILPLLPTGPYGPLGGVRPRTLWTVVLLISGLNYAGYLARRIVGETRGYGIAGALGGLVSSTAVTLAFAQRSRVEPRHGAALGLGVLAACTVLIPRVFAISWALNPALGMALAPALVPPLLLGLGVVIFLRRRRAAETEETDAPPVGNPLQLWLAIRMAVAFQLVLFAVGFASDRFGAMGLYGTAGVLGLTDMDALTFSMSRLAETSVTARTAAQAVVVGMTANTLLKLVVALAIGAPGFRRAAGLGLAGLAVAMGLGLAIVFG